MRTFLIWFFVIQELGTKPLAKSCYSYLHRHLPRTVTVGLNVNKNNSTQFDECGEQHNFCENVENYPRQTFRTILENNRCGRGYLRSISSLNIEQTFVSSQEESDYQLLCPVKKSVIYPKAAYNDKNEYKLIYNFDDYKQAVPIQVCEGRENCGPSDLKIYFLNTQCYQKYYEMKLLTADEDGEPYLDIFRFPSACICTYKST